MTMIQPPGFKKLKPKIPTVGGVPPVMPPGPARPETGGPHVRTAAPAMPPTYESGPAMPQQPVGPQTGGGQVRNAAGGYGALPPTYADDAAGPGGPGGVRPRGARPVRGHGLPPAVGAGATSYTLRGRTPNVPDGGTELPPGTTGREPPPGTTEPPPPQNLRGNVYAPVPGQDLTRYRGMRDDAAGNLANGPTRQQIAQQNLEAFDTAAAPQIRDQIRAVGQRAAALGRTGMGDTEVETMRPYTDYLTQRQAMATQLAADTAEGEIGDRRYAVDAMGRMVRDEYGYERGDRDEWRDERSWQRDEGQLGIENRIRGRQLESGEQMDEYNRRLQAEAMRMGVDPSMIYFGASNQFGRSSANNMGGSAELIAQILARQNQR